MSGETNAVESMRNLFARRRSSVARRARDSFYC